MFNQDELSLFTRKQLLLSLTLTPGLGPVTIQKLLTRVPLEEIYQRSSRDLMKAGVPEKLSALLLQFNPRSHQLLSDRLRKHFDWFTQEDYFYVSIDEHAYPEQLKHIHGAPSILFGRGEVSALLTPQLGVVGSRKATQQGLEHAHHFSKQLSNVLSITSGLAQGIDAKAHEGCLAAQGTTIAVMATGIDQVYPRAHKSLAKNICEKGCLITEYALDTPPKPTLFPRRNRIISGLSDAILVVEASIQSGSMITCKLALEHNRDIFAIPGSIDIPQYSGNNQLIQQGAYLVTSPEDIIRHLGLLHINTAPLQAFDAPSTTFTPPISALSEEERNILMTLSDRPAPLDLIAHLTGQSISTLSRLLLNLEMKDYIKNMAGGFVRIC